MQGDGQRSSFLARYENYHACLLIYTCDNNIHACKPSRLWLKIRAIARHEHRCREPSKRLPWVCFLSEQTKERDPETIEDIQQALVWIRSRPVWIWRTPVSLSSDSWLLLHIHGGRSVERPVQQGHHRSPKDTGLSSRLARFTEGRQWAPALIRRICHVLHRPGYKTQEVNCIPWVKWRRRKGSTNSEEALAQASDKQLALLDYRGTSPLESCIYLVTSNTLDGPRVWYLLQADTLWTNISVPKQKRFVAHPKALWKGRFGSYVT